MSYTYTLKNAPRYRVRRKITVPWPCVFDRDRTITLRTSDVLRKDDDGTFQKETGLGCFHIVLKPHQVRRVKITGTMVVVGGV